MLSETLNKKKLEMSTEFSEMCHKCAQSISHVIRQTRELHGNEIWSHPHKLLTHPHPFTLYVFYLLFKQLHVITNTSITVVCISMEMQVFKSV